MAVTVTPRNDFDPCPRVEIVWSQLPDANRVVVMRKWDGRSAIVRGGNGIANDPTGFLVDYEAPLDTPLTYEVVGWTNLPYPVGSSGDSAVIALEAGLDASRLAILQDPYEPNRCIPTLLEGGAVSSLSYSRDVSLLQPLAGDRIGLAGRMGLAGGIPFSLFTVGDEDAATVLVLLTDTYPLVVRSVAPVELPRLAYASIAGFRRVPIQRDRAGWTQWEITIDLVRAPSASIVAAAHTYDEVKRIYATYGDLRSAKETYLDVRRDPRVSA